MLGNHATLINRMRFLIADWVLHDAKAFYLRNPLTQLPTRNALEAAARKSGYYSLFLDLDNLKEINRTRGYHVGDQAIIDVANCIIQHVRSSDLVSHWGGDEFAVLLFESSLSAATRIARRILTHINQLGYSVSIGIGDSIEMAQQNQQEAKARGKNQLLGLNVNPPREVNNQRNLSQLSSRVQIEIRT